jgi:hypothetical protein
MHRRIMAFADSAGRSPSHHSDENNRAMKKAATARTPSLGPVRAGSSGSAHWLVNRFTASEEETEPNIMSSHPHDTTYHERGFFEREKPTYI